MLVDIGITAGRDIVQIRQEGDYFVGFADRNAIHFYPGAAPGRGSLHSVVNDMAVRETVEVEPGQKLDRKRAGRR